MKYLKTFENIQESLKKLSKIKTNSSWVIYGDINIIIEILSKINILAIECNNSRHEPIDRLTVERLLKEWKSKEEKIGIILYYSMYGFSFSIIKNHQNFIDRIKIGSVYNFKGEIKLINNELYIDTLEKDMMKYNL